MGSVLNSNYTRMCLGMCAGLVGNFRAAICLRDLPRPFKVWGFPVVPAFFMIAVIAIAITVLIERPLHSFAGLIILALGIPA